MAAAKEKTTTADSETKTEAIEAQVKSESVKQTESIYMAEELSANAGHLFGVKAECVAAALKIAGISECTVSKTKEIVKEFMKKEVQ